MLLANYGPYCFSLSVLRFKLMIGPRGRFSLGRRGGLIRLWLENIGAIKVDRGNKAKAYLLWLDYVYIKNWKYCYILPVTETISWYWLM